MVVVPIQILGPFDNRYSIRDWWLCWWFIFFLLRRIYKDTLTSDRYLRLIIKANTVYFSVFCHFSSFSLVTRGVDCRETDMEVPYIRWNCSSCNDQSSAGAGVRLFLASERATIRHDELISPAIPYSINGILSISICIPGLIDVKFGLVLPKGLLMRK